jgi:hypothetical protein
MASLVLAGDTSGSITVSAPAVAGSTTQTLVNVTGTLAPIVSGTAVTASGTSVDFTGIPSWVKRITVMFQGVSTNGTSVVQIQIGSGSAETTGYLSSTTSASSSVVTSNFTSGFGLTASGQTIATNVRHGNITLCLITSNNWTCSGTLGTSDNNSTTLIGGSKSISGVLDRVRITTVNGTDTFDAGTINILYE